MRRPVIYKIRNVVNNKFYVGSTVSTRERFRNHRKALRGNRHHCAHLQAAWNKYGEDCFKFEVVEEVTDEALLWDAENRWLDAHFGTPECYNAGRSADAPMRGRTGELSPNYGKAPTEEARQQISTKLKAFYAEDPTNHPRLGKLHSEETRQAISAKVQQAVSEGRGGAFIPSEETRAKMSASLKGNKNALGYKRTPAEIEAIRQRTLGNKNFLGKRHSEEAKDKMRRAMIGVTPSGEERVYAGLTVAAEELGVPYTMLVRLCKEGKVVSKGKLEGWFFAYQDEYKGRPEVAAPAIPEEYKDLPRTRQEAKSMGAKHYFTGIPCAHGHISPRLTKGSCVACRKEGLA